MDVCILAEKLSGMHLTQKSAISIDTPEPEYVLHLNSQKCEESSAKLAVSSTNNTIRLYSRNNLAYSSTINAHEKALTGVKFSPDDVNVVFSSSLDGTIKCWDLRQKQAKPVTTFEGSREENNVFTAFDVSCDGRCICAGTEADADGDIHIIFWDRRSTEKQGVYTESHQDDITQMAFHPTKRDHLLTASMDGLCCLFDISEDCEDDALSATLNPQSSVSQVGWCGRDSRSIYSVTHDNKYYRWDAEQYDLIQEVTDMDNIKEKYGMDYFVDLIQTNDPEDTLILAGTNSGGLSILKLQENEVVSEQVLKGGHSEVVRCVTLDKATGTMITGGEDAMLCLWQPGPSTAESHDHKDKRKAKATSAMKGKLKSRLK